MSIIDLILVILLGIVEGITEWLPISSTGHIILVREFFSKYANSTLQPDFFNMFDVVIQLGAIMAIVVIFFKRLVPIEYTNSELDFKNKVNIKNYTLSSDTCRDKWFLWIKVLIACVPAGIIGILFNDQIETFFNTITIGITLILYGILFIIIEKFNKKREFKIDSISKMSYKVVIIIGLIQLLALIPGTSRSGVTILGAMLLSCDRTVAAEFSFFLSIPIMFGASLIKLLDFTFTSSSELVLLLIGMFVSFIVSFFAVKALMNFIKKHDFSIFGYYRIVLGIIVLILFGFVF
ncbi:MAG: undecaprenyl-diphosphate phosphatase [bacterium]